MAPVCRMVFTVAQNVSGVVMTSSPRPTPAAIRLRCKAAVHEFTAAAPAPATPLYSANCASNALTRGPLPIQPPRSV